MTRQVAELEDTGCREDLVIDQPAGGGRRTGDDVADAEVQGRAGVIDVGELQVQWRDRRIEGHVTGHGGVGLDEQELAVAADGGGKLDQGECD